MPDAFGLDADVFFGDPDKPLPNWRKDAESTAEADDEEDSPQPGVAEMLGFDPKELDDESGPGDGQSKGFKRLMESAGEMWQEGKEYP